MPIIGISLEATRQYESTHDSAKGTPEATKFELGTIDSRMFGRIKDMATSISIDPNKGAEEMTTNINGNDVAFNTVLYGLRGWTNFNDETGKEIKFKTVKKFVASTTYKIADPEVVRLIPDEIIAELAAEIRKSNEVSEVEAKN